LIKAGVINEKGVTTVTNEILSGKLAQENLSFYPKVFYEAGEHEIEMNLKFGSLNSFDF
jgi:hypothetical protein